VLPSIESWTFPKGTRQRWILFAKPRTAGARGVTRARPVARVVRLAVSPGALALTGAVASWVKADATDVGHPESVLFWPSGVDFETPFTVMRTVPESCNVV